MKTEVQSSPELTRLSKLIENIPVAMMSTLDTDGSLVSRPMTALLMDALGALWFFTDLRSAKLDQLHAVNLAFAHSSDATYVSLSGHVEVSTDAARIQELWSPAAKPWFPEGTDSAHLGLLRFVPRAAEYWDAPSCKMVRMFAIVASIVAGRPVAMGEHDSFPNLAIGNQAAVLG